MLEIQRQIDKGQPFIEQCRIQQELFYYEKGLRLGLADLEGWKAGYDEAYVKHKFNAYRFCGIAFTGILPVVGCGGLTPVFDFDGRPLQKLGGDSEYEHVTYNLTVLNGSSLAVLGWPEGDDGPAAALASSFLRLAAAEKPEAAVRLAFEHLENIYLMPSWWHGLPETARRAAVSRMRSGLISVERVPECLKPDRHRYAGCVEVAEEITN